MADNPSDPGGPSRRPLVIVTGVSGGGKSTALRALEDVGFHCLDNLPLPLLAPLLDPGAPGYIDAPLAVGIDIRTFRHSNDASIVDIVSSLRHTSQRDIQLLFLDASDEVLIHRFSETRRPHPLRDGRSLTAAIAQERATLAPLLDAATMLDTSALSGRDLKAPIISRFGAAQPGLLVRCVSFGFARGVPRDADMVFDVRFLRNPHYEPTLKALTGLTPSVADYVMADPLFQPFEAKVMDLVDFLLPQFEKEGKAYLTLAFGCTGGKHRSVMMVARLAARVRERGYDVRTLHRDKRDES